MLALAELFSPEIGSAFDYFRHVSESVPVEPSAVNYS